jgi:hypothetical protein
MDKKQIVKTPLGNVQIGVGATGSSGPSASVEEIGKQFKKAAEQEIVPSEQISENEYPQPTNATH